MGWLDKLRRKATQKVVYADMLNGYTPIFSQFGDDIYASDVVQQAIRCIVQEVKKSTPTHVRTLTDCDVEPVNDSVQRVLNRPNELMTTTDFLEKITWILFLNFNAFIVPTYTVYTDANGTEVRNYTGLYPVQPVQVDFIQDASDRLFVKFTFSNDFETTLPYSDVIHIRYDYSVNEFMGGDESGQPNNKALLKTLEINHTLLQGVGKAMKASFAVNGVVKYNTMIDDGTIEKNVKLMEEKLQKSESGILPLDIKAEYIPIDRKVELVDKDTLEFIDSKILRHYGVPLPILTGDYTKEQYEAFYQKTIENVLIAISQAMTRALFTDRQLSFGHVIKLYPKKLIFMSVDQTLEMVNLLGQSGTIFENEKRVSFGLMPVKELVGVRMQSLNWVNVEDARRYQMGKAGAETDGGGE